MQIKLATLSAAGVVAMAFLLGASTALAQTVEMDVNTATAIRDLELNGVTYDVEFLADTAARIYGDPPVFDFSNRTDAAAAVQAVNDVLNAEGNVNSVGESSAECGGNNCILYRIGFSFFVQHFGGKDLNFDVETTRTWDGSGGSGVWVTESGDRQWPFRVGAIWADFIVAGEEPTPPPSACADINGQWAASIDSADLGDTVAGVSNMQLGNSSIDVWLYPTTNGGSSDDFGVGTYTVDQWCNVSAEITLDSDGSTSTMAGIIVNPDVIIFNFANQVNNSSARMVARRVRSGSCSDISGQWAATMDEVVDGAERPTVGNMQLGASSLDFWLFQSSQGNDINDFGSGSYTVDQWCNVIGEITLDSDGSVSRIAGIIVSPDVMIFNYANQVNSASARVIARRVQIP